MSRVRVVTLIQFVMWGLIEGLAMGKDSRSGDEI